MTEKAQEIAALIEENGAMTATALAEKVDVSRGTITKILQEGNFEKNVAGLWTVKHSDK